MSCNIFAGNFDNNDVTPRQGLKKSFGSMINVSQYKFD